MNLINATSIGCIEYGNDSIFEIMKGQNERGESCIGLMAHEDPTYTENPDGTFNGQADSLFDFIKSIESRTDYDEIKDELLDTCMRNARNEWHEYMKSIS